MYIKTDSTTLNRNGHPMVTDNLPDGFSGSTSGYIHVSGIAPHFAVSNYQWLPGKARGGYAYTGSGIVWFYDNKDIMVDEITAAYNKAVDVVTAGYSEQHQKSWEKKSRLSFAYNAMDSAGKSGCISNPDYNILVVEASQRGITLDDLVVNKIIPKATAFETAHGTLTGKWSKMITDVLALSGTDEEIYSGLISMNIDFS